MHDLKSLESHGAAPTLLLAPAAEANTAPAPVVPLPQRILPLPDGRKAA